MPLNYIQVEGQILDIIDNAPGFEETLLARLNEAKELLNSQNDLDGLRQKVERAASLPSLSRLRCAKPTTENFSQAYPLPSLVESAMVIAADGSQVYPDRNMPINFYAVNVGAISYPFNLPNFESEVQCQTSIRASSQLYNSRGQMISPDEVNFERDEAERNILADIVEALPSEIQNIFTLTDGNLEIWTQSETSEQEILEKFQPYFESLKKLRDKNALTTGYVDRPRARLVVELLEIARTPREELARFQQQRQYQGATDRSLLNDILINPGDRSALFEIQSPVAKMFKNESEDLALYFFYMNVGTSQNQRIARLEIPGWIANNPNQLDNLHALTYQQCNILGDLRYPYVLHRSHEEAIIKQEEKEEILQMLMRAYANNNLSVGEYSQKQSLKNLSGRRSFSKNGRKR